MLKTTLLALLAVAVLDGSEWRMRFRSERAWLPVWKADVMTFDGGVFKSQECASYGFSQGPYEAADSGWKSTQYNADGERADWEGRLEGEEMRGTLLWTRPDGRSRRYSFSARKTNQQLSTVDSR